MPAPVPRFAIGWHRNHPELLYVLCTGPTLWRVDGAPAAPVAAAVANPADPALRDHGRQLELLHLE
jgi:hypothetical protein